MTLGIKRKNYNKLKAAFLAICEHATGEAFFCSVKRAIARMDETMTGDQWGAWGAVLTAQAVIDGMSYKQASYLIGCFPGVGFGSDAPVERAIARAVGSGAFPVNGTTEIWSNGFLIGRISEWRPSNTNAKQDVYMLPPARNYYV